MALNDKTLLLISDNDGVGSEVEKFLADKVKKVIRAKTNDEAITKATNQTFDGFILRTTAPSLNNAKSAFNWCLTKDNYKRSPWIVLGKDVEDEQVLVKHNHVKFIEKTDDHAALKQMLEGVFFSTGSEKAPLIDVAFVNPIVAAVSETIKTMAQIELARETPFIKKPDSGHVLKGDISGIIAMNSNRFVGSIAFSFEEKLILKVYQNMLGTELREINDDVKDCVNELTNIIFGNAKRDLNAAGHTIAAALPSVITGKGHEIRHTIQGLCLVIPFTAPHGRLNVECVINTQMPQK